MVGSGDDLCRYIYCDCRRFGIVRVLNGVGVYQESGMYPGTSGNE